MKQFENIKETQLEKKSVNVNIKPQEEATEKNKDIERKEFQKKLLDFIEKEKKYSDRIYDYLYEFKDYLDNDIALLLAESSIGGYIVIKCADLFPILNKEIALKVIEESLNTFYHFKTMALFFEHINHFQGLDEEVALALIERGYSESVLEHKKEFQGLTLDNDMALLMIKNGGSAAVLEHKKEFQGLTLDNDMALLMIKNGGSAAVFEHKKEFQGLTLDNDMALLMIENHDAIIIFEKYIDQFHGLNKEVILLMIKKYNYHISAFHSIFEHINQFQGLDEEVALALIERGYSESVIKHKKNFQGLTLNKKVALLITETWRKSNLVISYADQFQGLDKEVFLILLEGFYNIHDSGIELDLLIKHINHFQGLDKEVFLRLVDRISTEDLNILTKHINHFQGLDEEVFLKLIKKYQSAAVLEHKKEFQGLTLDNDMALLMIENGGSATVLEHKKEFQGLTLDNDMALLMIEKFGGINVLKKHMNEFQGLGKEVALVLIKEGYLESIIKHINHFQGLDKEVFLRLVDRIYTEDLNILTRHINHFQGLDEEVFLILLEKCYDIDDSRTELDILIKHINQFQGLDQNKIALLMTKNEEAAHALISNITEFNDLSERDIVLLLINNARSSIVVSELESGDLKGLGKETFLRLAENGHLRSAIEHINSFQGIDLTQILDNQIQAKNWENVLILKSQSEELQLLYEEALRTQKDIAINQKKQFIERQKAFDILANLAKNGDHQIADEFSKIIKQRSKQKTSYKSKWGLDPIQESAFYTLIRLDNPSSNSSLFDLLDNENVSTTIKYQVFKKLTRKDRGFLDKKTKQILKEWFYKKSPKELEWQDLKFIKAILNISSTELRNKSKKQICGTMQYFIENKGSVYQDWKQKYNNIPKNIFLQLWQLAEGSSGLLNKFQNIYTVIRKNRTKDDLLYGVVNILEINPETINSLVEKLREADLYSKQDAEMLSSLLRKTIFLDNIKTKISLSKKVNKSIKEIFQKETRSLEEQIDLLEEITTKIVQEILPNQHMTAKKIEEIEKSWNDLEPIFTYVGRYPNMKKYIAKMLVNFDNDKNWKNWRYNLKNKIVKDQIGHLSKEQLEIWQGDYFLELGDIVVTEDSLDQSQKIKNLLQEAIVTDKHIFNPETKQNKNEFIQKTLEQTYIKIAKKPDQREKIIETEINNIRKDVDQINTIIGLSNIPKIKQSINEFFLKGQKINLSSKVKYNVKFLSNFLSDELRRMLTENYRQAKTKKKSILSEKIITPKIRQALNKAIQEIEKKNENIDSFDIWDKHNLDKINLKNLGQFYQKNQELTATINLLKLNNLSGRLIAANQIEDKKGKEVGQTLLSAIEGLKKYFKGSSLLQDLENIEFSLKEKQEIAGKKKLAIIFTDNPQFLWKVGKYPLGCGSCQHYSTGSIARNLMGYVGDANCKVAYLVNLNKLSQEWRDKLNEQGFNNIKDEIPPQILLNISLGRTIVKMTQHKPIVLLEPTYTVSYKGDASMDKYFNMFIDLVVANPMNAKMARDGGNMSVSIGSSRSPNGQYEDLSLSHIKLISGTSNPTKKDREVAERIRTSQ